MARKKRYQLQGGELVTIEERPSRSAKKRQATALQNLGEELAGLPSDVWSNLPDDLREALRCNAGLKDHEARRRQQQYIGRLMREMDEDTLSMITRLVMAAKNSSKTLDFTNLIA